MTHDGCRANGSLLGDVGIATVEGVEMDASDQLSKLTSRAKEAEDRVAAAKEKTKAELEQDVEHARASAQAQADKLRESAHTNKGKLSVWWHDLQHSWDEHVEKMRVGIESRRAEHDAERAEIDAGDAAEDATFAIEYALTAIEEAEYAVLDAELAKKKADELAAAEPSTNT